jgi:hypothetical protein
MQIFHAFVIQLRGIYRGIPHDLLPIDTYRVAETVTIPVLEKAKIEDLVNAGQPSVITIMLPAAAHVFDVIYHSVK